MAALQTGDSELIERIRRREADGLAAAYDRYSSTAFSVLFRITRDRAIAEDLLQELFLRVWNRAHLFEAGRGGLGVWILSIARNMAIDHVRSASAKFSGRTRALEDVDPLFLASGYRDVESLADRRALITALSALSSNEKRALELAYFEGLTQTEIAAKMEEPLGTVKSWIRTGLARMRSAMKAEAATS